LIFKHAQVTLVCFQTPANFCQPFGVRLKIGSERGFLFGHALNVRSQFTSR
jgi:hypothetical protein